MNKYRVLLDNFRSLVQYRAREVRLKDLPTYYWIEPTNHCNLRCIMCPNGAGMVEIEKGYMPLELFREIIAQIREHASAIVLAVHGESLLHPDFCEMVRLCREAGIKVHLNTNATLLTEERIPALLDAGLCSVSFAFDGFSAEAYEQARVGADFEKTLGNILHFLRQRDRRGLKLPYTVLSVLELGLEEKTPQLEKKFLNRFEGLLDELRLREVSTWGKTFNDTGEFSYRDNRRHYPPCSRLWSTMVITWNGDVVPCIYFANHEYPLGNVREQSLREIWNGEPMLRLRRSMLDGSYLEFSPLCENCIVLGTPPLCGIPSGLRLTLADAATNLFGYGFERLALKWANRLTGGRFSSRTIE